MTDASGPTQIDLKWRDAVGKPHHTAAGDERPHSTLLTGTPWLIEETETDLVVCSFISEDGGFLDIISIPKTSVESREPRP